MPANVKFWPQGKRNLLPLKKCSTRVLPAKTFSYVTVYAQDAVKSMASIIRKKNMAKRDGLSEGDEQSLIVESRLRLIYFMAVSPSALSLHVFPVKLAFVSCLWAKKLRLIMLTMETVCIVIVWDLHVTRALIVSWMANGNYVYCV